MKNLLTQDDYDWIDDKRDVLKKEERKHIMINQAAQTDEYLIDTFPESQEIVMRNLAKYWDDASKLYAQMKEIRNIVDHQQTESFNKWFYLKWNRYTQGKELKLLQDRISRLERQKILFEKREAQKHLSKEFFKTKTEREKFDIDKMFARQGLLVDLAMLDGISLKRSGSILKGLCPFHTEKTPSFYIYIDNWFHCFGCQVHGNFLDYLMKKKNMTFREALEEANRYL